MGSAIGSDELITPPRLSEVLKTLEHFGIYQRFECIKCDQNFATINLALAHLRGEYLECKKDNLGPEQKKGVQADGARAELRVSRKEDRERSVLRTQHGEPPNQSKHSSPKKAPLLSNKHHKIASKYSIKQIEMILNKKKRDTVFAKQFGITTRDVAKLRYTWKKKGQFKNLLIVTPDNKSAVVAAGEVVHNRKGKNKEMFHVNKAKGSQDYKVQPADVEDE